MRKSKYVCSALYNEIYVTKEIIGNNLTDIKESFNKLVGCYPTQIFGPYRYKKEKINKQEVKLSNIVKTAFYKERKVKAFILIYPEDHALIIGLEKNKILPISELRIENE